MIGCRVGSPTFSSNRSPAPRSTGTGPKTLSYSYRVVATYPRVVADQADKVAAAWSPPGAPSSWGLTASQFEALRDDEELLAIAATIPPDKLPPLLFAAAASFLVLDLQPRPLRDFFPHLGEPQPALDSRFSQEYRAFCLDHRDRLLELCALHRYQMNEVGRCADLLPALTDAINDQREIVLVDLGTGAGLALHMDRYRYVYRGQRSQLATVGDPDSTVVIETELRGQAAAPIPSTLPKIADRIGIDIEPLELADPEVRAWLAACIPQEIGAVTRFHNAVEIAIEHPARSVRGDASAMLPGVLEAVGEWALVCVLDTYVHVFFGTEQLLRFRALIERIGARRDLDWVSVDPLVPMGESASDSVLGVSVPVALLERNRREGVFGVIGRLSYREGHRSGALLGLAHPGAAWLEWLGSE